jgi:anti-sigma factor RsiW
MSGMLDRLLGPGEPELTCEACFDLLDCYVDLEVAGADADRQVPAMRAHLTGCPACAEEYLTLRALAEAGSDAPPAPA